MRLFILTLFLLSLTVELGAQTFFNPQKSYTQSELLHQTQTLPVFGRILYIAAHPDDENTRLITWLVKEKKLDVAYLSLTRGDGGQNLIGEEQAVELGLIRSQELLAARNIDGAKQFFTRAYDFGYSKTATETFKKWDKEKILSDVVYIIRYYKPDIIICRFPATGEGGHGHHTASAILAQEAFIAAADKNKFPEQLKELETWQARRLLWNTFNFGNRNTTAEDQFKTDVGTYNILLGKSYGEIAAESRSQHRSQGFGTEKRRGEQLEYFKTIIGEDPIHSLTDGIDLNITRLVSHKEIKTVESINQIYQKIISPSQTNPLNQLIEFRNELILLKKQIDKKYHFYPDEKIKQCELLIAYHAGLWMDCNSDEQIYAQGNVLKLNIRIIARNNTSIKMKSFKIMYEHKKLIDSTINKTLEQNSMLQFNTSIVLNDATISQPYWLKEDIKHDMYVLNQQSLREPWKNHLLQCVFSLEINNETIEYTVPVQYKYVNPSYGEIYQPVELAPDLCLNITDDILIFNEQKNKTIKIIAKSFAESVNKTILIHLPEGWKCNPTELKISLDKKGQEKEYAITITAPQINQTTQNVFLRFSYGGKSVLSYKQIKYEHIPLITYFPEAKINMVNTRIKTSNIKIAYIAGPGDKVPAILKQLGYTVHTINEHNFYHTDLKQYESVITGVRAYNTEKWLAGAQDRLMEYVYNGGNLLQQYNTSANLVTDKLGPYPFKLSRNRVTEEDTPVEFINTKHILLQSPNKITQQDFTGWVQERGLYFTYNADKQYEKLFVMSDEGEDMNDGAVLYCQYGKGKYVYSSLSFFRQLPAGNAGAIKLFVNFIEKNYAQ